MTDKEPKLTRERELYLLSDRIFTLIRDQFPEAIEEQGWRFKELETDDENLITIGFDGSVNEAAVSIEYKDQAVGESISYVIKPGSVRKEGSAALLNHDSEVMYTDDEKVMDNAEKINPRIVFRPTLRVGLAEFQVVARIAEDTVENAKLIKDPLLRFPRPEIGSRFKRV